MILYISKENIITFINSLSTSANIFYIDRNLNYRKYEENPEEIYIDGVRAKMPIRAFFVGNGQKVTSLESILKQNVIFGVKACDITALKVLDKIYLEGVEIDLPYKNLRDNTFIISVDCIEVQDTCFCILTGNKPYPEGGYDINLTLVNNGYVCDIRTQKAEELVKKYRTLFSDISDKVIDLRNREREKSITQLKSLNKDYIKIENLDLQKIMKAKFSDNKWKKESEKCVQCCGCNVVCPSCYCFLLAESENKNFERIRYWDYCHYTSYARVAGGMNPRPALHERFRNRYQCKFNYRKTNFDFYACTGCGRCIEVCPAKIDIRKVLSNISE